MSIHGNNMVSCSKIRSIAVCIMIYTLIKIVKRFYSLSITGGVGDTFWMQYFIVSITNQIKWLFDGAVTLWLVLYR